MGQKIHVIGIGSDGLFGLTTLERDILAGCDIIFGSENVLRLVESLKGEKRKNGPDLQELSESLQKLDAGKKVALLVSGDPLFYGVVRYLSEKIGKDRFEVHPHVSSMQMAFARVKESWDDAYLTSLQNQSLDKVIEKIRVSETVGIFTNTVENPGEIAKRLLARGIDYFKVFVCENLGGKDERVTQAELSEIVDMDFDPLNVLILKRKPGRPDIPQHLVLLGYLGILMIFLPRVGLKQGFLLNLKSGPLRFQGFPLNQLALSMTLVQAQGLYLLNPHSFVIRVWSMRLSRMPLITI